MVEDARALLAGLLGSPPDAVVWTGGGTESDNWAVGGLAFWRGKLRRILMSAVEHPAVAEAAAGLRAEGTGPDWAQGLVRISLGRETTAADIEAAAGRV
ncbi:MAG: aminotransferase class V-fold PLP-dependent enzyme [Peptococcaceae bacterium]|nr:aminotransferase class V-fold PLP-dependent enzyme [Peptococcaceae bacterium]